MTEEKSSYRQIIKATSIFGGVQAFNIIISILRSKIIALLLGPLGMGISGMLNSTLSLIGTLVNCGLSVSAVRNVAEANLSVDKVRISTTIYILRKLVWLTGIIGTIVTIICSSWLSRITFGNSEYTYAFIWLSITLLFNQLSSGQMALLQGLRKINYLARATVSGSILGLLCTTPLYYFFSINAIVPAIIIISVLNFFRTWYFANKVRIEHIHVDSKVMISEVKTMLVMGFLLTLSSLVSNAVSYVIKVYISNRGSLYDVGLYSAGFAIIGYYVGMIFTAMGTDYYPRLTSVVESEFIRNKTINQQAEIGILVISPILAVFLVFINPIIIILYSNKFLPINDMIHWAALGIYFKTVMWSIGFLFLAKGAKSVFFFSELASNVLILILNILGYKYWGFSGLGISFLISYIIGLIQVYLVAKIKWNFRLENNFYTIFIIQFLIILTTFILIKLIEDNIRYVFGTLLIFICFWYSYKELDKRIDFKSILNRIKDKA